MEVFDPVTGNISLLEVMLPEKTSCCVFACDSDMVVLSANYATWWSAHEAKLVRKRIKTHSICNVITNLPPVVRDGTVYLSWWGECYRFQLESCEDIV